MRYRNHLHRRLILSLLRYNYRILKVKVANVIEQGTDHRNPLWTSCGCKSGEYEREEDGFVVLCMYELAFYKVYRYSIASRVNRQEEVK